jgi:hypothetical protein
MSDRREKVLNVGQDCYTHLGKGKVAYILRDGTVLVEFFHGGGMVVPECEVFVPSQRATPARPFFRNIPDYASESQN